MQRFQVVIDTVARAMMYVATAAGIALSVFVALASVMRYLIGAPFAFTEEIVGLLFTGMVFLSLPYCSLRNRHIEVTFVTDRLPAGWRRWSATAATCFSVAFCAAFGYFAFEFTWLSFELNSKSDIGLIPLWPWMAAMPVACLLMGVAAFLRHQRRRHGPDDDRQPF